mmetsp:Transcript_6982/g.18732  ORF Transcript_6982/g.18732 Transcript_6982/m.18732 type:complete len:560 (+) Transcript_6982:37-1716(+)
MGERRKRRDGRRRKAEAEPRAEESGSGDASGSSDETRSSLDETEHAAALEGRSATRRAGSSARTLRLGAVMLLLATFTALTTNRAARVRAIVQDAGSSFWPFTLNPGSDSVEQTDATARLEYFGFADHAPALLTAARTEAAATAGDVVLVEGLDCSLWKRDLFVPRVLLEPEDSSYRFLLMPNSIGDLSRDLVHANIAINMCLLFNLSLAIPSSQRAKFAQYLNANELGVSEEDARVLIKKHRSSIGAASEGDGSGDDSRSLAKVTLTIDSISAAARQLPSAAMIEVLLSRSSTQLSPLEEAAFARFARDAFFSAPLLRVAHYTYLKALRWSGRLQTLTHNVLDVESGALNVAVYVPEARPEHDVDGNRTALLRVLAHAINALEPVARALRSPSHGADSANSNAPRAPALHVAVLDRRDSSASGGGEARVVTQLSAMLDMSPSIAYLNVKLWPAVGMREMLRADVLLAPPTSASCYFAALARRGLNLLYGVRSTDSLMSLAGSLHSLVVAHDGSFDVVRAERLLRLQAECRPLPPSPPPSPPPERRSTNRTRLNAFLDG